MKYPTRRFITEPECQMILARRGGDHTSIQNALSRTGGNGLMHEDQQSQLQLAPE
jgi:hypothetical protein